MNTNLISILVGCGILALVIAVSLIAITKNKKSTEIAKNFIEGLSEDILVKIVEIVKNFDVSKYKTLEEFEVVVLRAIYDTTFKYIKEKLEEALGQDSITVKIANMINEDMIIKFIDGLIEKENVNALIENTYGTYKIENDKSINEDKAVAEKFNSDDYIETISKEDMPPAEDIEPTEEQKKNLNPQKDEEEKFDIQDDSMEVVVDKPEIITKKDKNGIDLYYEVSSDGKKKRVTKEYAAKYINK